MKTNREILEVIFLIDTYTQYLKDEELKPFKYAFLRNKLRFAKNIEERDTIVKHLREEFDLKNSPKSKNYEDKWNEFINTSDKFNEFLDEFVEAEYYTVSLDKLENEKDFSIKAANALLGTIIVE